VSQEERKQEPRRKILAGAMGRDRGARKEVPEKLFKAGMDRFLEREPGAGLVRSPAQGGTLNLIFSIRI